jgi:signal transduction histidine kinase
LQSNFFAAGNRSKGSGFKGADGTLYFGGENGFNFFNPTEIKANSYLAPIVITQFQLFDKLVKGANELSEIVLDYDENYFSFEFSSLSYYSPAKNQYAYILEGVDKEWVHSGSRHYVGYTNIDPGKYVFKVKGTNSDGVWNEKGTNISIIINPPWWRTWWAYAFYGACIIAAIFLLDRYQRKRLINKEREQTRERELQQAHEIEKAYEELKSTQAQLIQREKMASLGELTAGIAHEIQNPLNFVNNFSEVNNELISELVDEVEKGNTEEVKAIATDIKQNLEKINHHGRRADAIVKGMLQHSRTSTGQKEPTDINILTDEYLRLSYHGLRAKDKSFNATLKTDYDKSIGNINIVPQEIGRVLLNLFNNAFYTVNEKKKLQPVDYEPTVSISTKKLNDKIEISVKDNGNGIPQNIVDKIFQPFFTTKPAGEGTGLGLSLSYDIIKAHEGELKVETKEGKGSEFIIQLPAA